MPTPYLHNELFEPNEILDVDVMHTNSGVVVVVDNFYKRPDDIHWMLEKSWVEDWKHDDDSKNFKEYYDCRLTIELNNHFQSKAQQSIWNIIGQCYDDFRLVSREEPLRFNLFKWINTPEQQIQHYPHTDSHFDKCAGVIYLDKHEDGGTAIYDANGIMSVEREVGYSEDNDIGVDIDKLGYKYDVIPARYNRLVIYPGWYMHGGFITNHNTYTNDWRMNQVFFWDVSR